MDIYYGNISIKGCTEEQLKSLKLDNYKKVKDYYCVECSLKYSEFYDLMETLKDCKIMAFVGGSDDGWFQLVIKDEGTEATNSTIDIFNFDYVDEDWFIQECYPTDKFTYVYRYSQTGMFGITEYENPALEWWNGSKSLEESLDEAKISFQECDDPYEEYDENFDYEKDMGLSFDNTYNG